MRDSRLIFGVNDHGIVTKLRVHLQKHFDCAKGGGSLLSDLQGQVVAVGGGGGAGHIPEHRFEELFKVS